MPRCSWRQVPGPARPRRWSSGSPTSLPRAGSAWPRSQPSRSPRRPPPSCESASDSASSGRRRPPVGPPRSGSGAPPRWTRSTRRLSRRCTGSPTGSCPLTPSRPACRRASRSATPRRSRWRSRPGGRPSSSICSGTPTSASRCGRRWPWASASTTSETWLVPCTTPGTSPLTRCWPAPGRSAA